MAIGDAFEVDVGDVSGVHYVDVGVFSEPGRGAVYLIDAERPAIVDAGAGTNYELVLDVLASVGIAPADLEVIALTHVHLDHTGGTGYLARECPNAEVYVHPVGARHVNDSERLVEGTKAAVGAQWEHYAEPVPVPADRVTEIADGDAVDLGDRFLEYDDQAFSFTDHVIGVQVMDRGVDVVLSFDGEFSALGLTTIPG